MKAFDATAVLRRAEAAVEARTKRSATLFERARTLIPGGVSSNIRYAAPHPVYVREARGGHIWDVDGNEYVDCRLGFGPVLLGHAPEEISAAATHALARGTVYALSHEGEVDLAEKIAAVVPGADMTTFCSSGSEATLHAIRVARAFTGRKKVAKFEGGYHGIHDTVLVSTQHRPNAAGAIEAPQGTVESPGIPEESVANTVVLPFNHPAALDAIAAQADDLAAVIVEPLQGSAGSIPGTRSFLESLREVTERHGVVLIFDEVITGFRLALGGAQERYGVHADLATFGKVLGGGFPLGCVTGRRDIMEFFSVPGARTEGRVPVFNGGTFNGNPISVAAANAMLDFLGAHRELYTRLDEHGDRIRREVATAAAAQDLDVTVLGDGSIFSLRFVSGPVASIRDFAHEDPMLPQALFLLLLADGVLTHPRHSFLCAAHTDADVERVIDSYRAALGSVADACRAAGIAQPA